MAALDGAIALGQVAALAILVSGNLDFDVAGFRHELLHVHAIVAEGGPGFAAGGVPRVCGVLVVVADPHASAATTGSGLEHDRVPDFLGAGEGVFEAVEDAFAAGNGRHTGGGHRGLGGCLVAHGLDHLGRSPNELDVILGTHAGKLGVLREESVAGVNRIGIGDFRCRDDVGNVEVALGALRRANANRLVGETHVEALRVGCGIHRHRLDAHFLAGADHPEGNLTAVGDQDFLEHVVKGLGQAARLRPVPRGRAAGRIRPGCCRPPGS